ncbi:MULTISPECIES: hypothetical protein [unclassified Flavobacterium]|uniref:hypothetical protein n=1 Tax=unclassified Flavobacterium TaxID=196869 RepID=UPI003F8DE4C8
MQKIILITILFLSAFIVKINAQEKKGAYKYVEDWSYWQPESPNYEMSLEKNTAINSQNTLTIRSIKNKFYGFGTLMKTTKSDDFLGKTVRMTAYVKSENVKSWAGLWMRVDYYDAAVLAFDNMQNRGIKRTTDWTKYEVVLFVPEEATSISYGALLDGTGQIWFKDIVLEVVDDTVPETGSTKGREYKVLSFEKRAKAIGSAIKKITKNEKEALKTEVDVIDKEVEKGLLSKKNAEDLKLKKAEERATNIDTKVAIEEEKLNQLIQDQVDGKLEEESVNKSGGTMLIIGASNDSIGKNKTEINLTSLKVYNGHDDKINRHYKRTTSQMVFATGLNNLVTNKSIQNSDFRYLGSHFYEWGLTYNSRILKDANLLHAKYGVSLMYNNLRATDNRSFVVNGAQTNLEVNPVAQEDSRFRMVSLVFPVHLEFDFSRSRADKTYFKTHDSFRIGLGGYFGTNLKSKQIIKYEDDNYKSTERVRGDFNVSNFVYGLSTYVGYKATSLYLKYDLNPLFTDNTVKQNNASLGVRFDFN